MLNFIFGTKFAFNFLKYRTMKIQLITCVTFALIGLNTEAQLLKDALNKGKEVISTQTATSSLTNDEVISGLKEALSLGAKKSAEAASLADGFYKNPRIFIPFPPEAQKMKDKLIALGMTQKVEAFETSLNRAAEEASKEAYSIFVEAVKGMSVGDGFAILNGGDTAATHYLREKTYNPLEIKFAPIVSAAIEKVQVTAYWTPLVTTYNRIPGVTKQNPDLEAYVTAKAINGLLFLISEQEAKIRKDPAAQATELLKKVFGNKK
jgi:phosphoribosyl-dephospho-CoA transferase